MLLKHFRHITLSSIATTTGSVSLLFFTASYFHNVHREYNLQHHQPKPPNPTAVPRQSQQSRLKMIATNQKVKAPFQTLFNVHMTCDDCIKAVSDSLYSLDGVTKVDADLKEQLVTVEGTAAPSAIVSAIEATGRDAILRGSGAPNSSAVCILETFHHDDRKAEATTEDGKQREVRGLARMVQVSPDTTLVDLTLHGVDAGKYTATIRAYGDLSDGAATTGPIWAGGSGTTQPRGLLGSLEIGKDGKGAVFLDHPLQVWEVIGHSMVVSRQDANESLQNDENTVVGVIARSAGMWENLKQVCSCSGKTLWEERVDGVAKGMI